MDKLMFSLSVAAIGMLVVFAGLIILIFCIKAITLFGKQTKTTATKAEKVEVAPVIDTPVVSADGIPEEVIVAITAAIANVWESPNAFVVRHVKRVSNAPSWNRAGREEQVYSRF